MLKFMYKKNRNYLKGNSLQSTDCLKSNILNLNNILHNYCSFLGTFDISASNENSHVGHSKTFYFIYN